MLYLAREKKEEEKEKKKKKKNKKQKQKTVPAPPVSGIARLAPAQCEVNDSGGFFDGILVFGVVTRESKSQWH